MLVSGSGATVVDGGRHSAPAALWVCDAASARTRHLPVERAAWVAVRAGADDLFAVEHHHRRGIVAVSVRSLDAPEEVIASAGEESDGWTFAGDARAWAAVPRAYRDDNAVLLLDPAAGAVVRQACAWFGPERY